VIDDDATVSAGDARIGTDIRRRDHVTGSPGG
jgi:hypothetical protein